MKKLLPIAFILSMFSFAACSEGGGDDSGAISVPDTQQSNLTQEIAASNTSASGVTFTTLDAWTSTILTSKAEAEEWCSISPDHGDEAGTYTIAITLQPNETGEERTARIVIRCGDEEITITVTQSATDDVEEEGGEEGNEGDAGNDSEDNTSDNIKFNGPMVKKLLVYDVDVDSGDEELMTTATFEYDIQYNRLTNCVLRYDEGEYDYEEYIFTWPDAISNTLKLKVNDWIQINEEDIEYDGYEQDMSLDDTGKIIYATSGVAEGEHTTLHYNGDKLVNIEYSDGRVSDIEWEANNLTTYNTYDTLENSNEPHYKETYTFGNLRNYFLNSAVDPVMLSVNTFMSWSFGMAGRHNDMAIETIKYTFDGEESSTTTHISYTLEEHILTRVDLYYKNGDVVEQHEYLLLEYYQ